MATDLAIEKNRAASGISRGLVVLLAVACGTSVANLYYAQPLLHTIAVAFHSGSGTTGLIVTGCQVGYAVGLALLVPLGDLVARKRLVPAVLGVTVVGLVLSACAGGVSRAHRRGALCRPRVGRRPDARPPCSVARKRGVAGTGRRVGDERAFARDPARTDALRSRRWRCRLADRLLGRRRLGIAARHRARLAAAGRTGPA